MEGRAVSLEATAEERGIKEAKEAKEALKAAEEVQMEV